MIVVGAVTVKFAWTVALVAPDALKVIVQGYDPGLRPDVFNPKLAAKGVFPTLELSVSQPQLLPGKMVTYTPVAGFILPMETDCVSSAGPPIS